MDSESALEPSKFNISRPNGIFLQCPIQKEILDFQIPRKSPQILHPFDPLLLPAEPISGRDHCELSLRRIEGQLLSL